MDVDATLKELTAQHDQLTEAYQQAKTNGTRAQYREARNALSAFRGKYGKVIKALDEASKTGQTEV